MENEEFLRLCKAKVAEYTNAHMDNTDRQQIHVNDVYLVWSWTCKDRDNAAILYGHERTGACIASALYVRIS